MLQIFVWLWRVLLRLLGIRRESPPKATVDDRLRAEFQSLSQAALTQVSEQLLKLAEERFSRQMEAGSHELQTKKELIDQQLQNMKTELEKVSGLVQTLEKDREVKFGELTTQIKTISEQTVALTASTGTLREALASSRARGQWGERMAEDILRAVGMVEGVNYRKQTTMEGSGSHPDYTFLLPKNLTLNMDVKFPFDNYMRYVETDPGVDRDRYRANFLRDVRARIQEITSREYIDPGQSTLGYVLLFIPNESVYAFIREEDPSIFDVALQKKVVCCSPLTLFAVLGVVRQAVDNFSLEQTSNEILSLLGQFKRQWQNFGESMNTLGKRIASTQGAFDDLSGRRRRALDRPLERIEALRQRRGIPIAEGDSEPDEETPSFIGSAPQMRLEEKTSTSPDREGDEKP